MPFPQLLQALAETGANRLLKFDPASQRRLTRLAGKAILVRFSDLKLSLGFTATTDGLLVTGNLAAPDATVELPLAAASELTDSANIPRAIREGHLQLDGDPMLLKQFSELFAKLDVDWEGELARYVGDVPSHLAFSAVRKIKTAGYKAFSQFARWGAEQLTEETRLTPSRLEQQAFFDAVDDLKSDTAQLERRLARLEQL